MAKKKKKNGFIARIMQIPDRTWMLIFVLAVMVILTPLVIDFAIPEKTGVPSGSDPSDLIIIRDDADLLTDEEETALYYHMLPVTEYGGAAFYTSSSRVSSASSYAKRCFRENFGTGSGTLFLIDMYNREIYIFSDGKIYRKITNSKADTITDNVYRYATNGNYAECANRAFDQISTLLEGGVIPQYMRHVCNGLVAFAVSLLTVFFVANTKTRMQSDNEAAVFEQMAKKKVGLGDPTEQNLVKITRVRHVEESSGGGGGSSGGGGGGGGGGSSGGGGGHGF